MPETYLTIGLAIWGAIATLAAGGAIGWALAARAGRRAAERRVVEQQEAIDGHRADLLAIGERAQRAEVRVAELAAAEQGFTRRLSDQQAAFDKRLEEHRQAVADARGEAAEAFESLAGKQLEAANAKFLQLAETKFRGEQKAAEGELDKRRQAIDAMLKPINEALRKQEEAFASMDRRHRESHGGLTEQLRGLLDAQRHLSGTTDSLVKALRRPEVRGQWGEMILENAVQLAGMSEQCDFNTQITLWRGDAKQRPDMVVRLPGDGAIAVDAKTPVDAYLDALQADDESTRSEALDRFVRHVNKQVIDLAGKRYQEQFTRSPDMVILFIPGEAFVQAAVQRDPDLIRNAANRSVMIASPSTLIALLKAVALGWNEVALADNARHIAELGRQLHEQVAVVVKRVDTLGQRLESTVKAYNDVATGVDGRLRARAAKFNELKANSGKELPAPGEVKIVEEAVRDVRPIESDA